MRRLSTIFAAMAALLLLGTGAHAQDAPMTREQYIARYSGYAVSTMQSSGIPASITLAQGCLESANGNSRLAKGALNHFGIKSRDWDGSVYKRIVDGEEEIYRKYDSVEESYLDHADFLRTGARYAFLFDLDPNDYKGWAHGLKKAGYATDPLYAEKLIKIIEENDLTRFDAMTDHVPVFTEDEVEPVRFVRQKRYLSRMVSLDHEILVRNGVKCIVTNGDETWRQLADQYNLYLKEILDYNDITCASRKARELKGEETIPSGTIVYIDVKRAQGPSGASTHTVRKGETLHDVAQHFAIREKSLRKLNDLPAGREPKEGTILKLRKK